MRACKHKICTEHNSHLYEGVPCKEPLAGAILSDRWRPQTVGGARTASNNGVAPSRLGRSWIWRFTWRITRHMTSLVDYKATLCIELSLEWCRCLEWHGRRGDMHVIIEKFADNGKVVARIWQRIRFLVNTRNGLPLNMYVISSFKMFHITNKFWLTMSAMEKGHMHFHYESS